MAMLAVRAGESFKWRAIPLMFNLEKGRENVRRGEDGESKRKKEGWWKC